LQWPAFADTTCALLGCSNRLACERPFVRGHCVADGKKVVGAGFVHSLKWRAKLGAPWRWPRAALTIILLSLLLWAIIAAIALLAFN
jgi:hypothetical protein